MPLTRRAFLSTVAAAPALATPALAAPRTPGAQGPEFIVAALAPLGGDLQIDASLTRDYLAFQREAGVDGVLVNGTTGEFSALSTAERKRNLEVFLKHKGALSAMRQVGANSLPDTLDLLRHAQDSGADSALVLPPYYFNQPADDGLVRFFEPVLEAARIPVLLYNIPQVSEVELTLDLVRRHSKHERLAGIKDSWGKLERTLDYIRRFPKLRIFTGASSQIRAVLEAGGGGALTGNGNVFPAETAAVVRAFASGGDAAAAQKTLDERTALLQGYASMPAFKAALEIRGLGRMYVRPPFIDLTDAERASLRAKLRGAGVAP